MGWKLSQLPVMYSITNNIGQNSILLYCWAEEFKVCDVFCRYGQRKQTGQVG